MTTMMISYMLISTALHYVRIMFTILCALFIRFHNRFTDKQKFINGDKRNLSFTPNQKGYENYEIRRCIRSYLLFYSELQQKWLRYDLLSLSLSFKLQDLERLKQIYANYDQVDLIMGAIAERPKPGATVGETFSCIIGKLS